MGLLYAAASADRNDITTMDIAGMTYVSSMVDKRLNIFTLSSDSCIVTISLTVLMEEEATRVDLCTGNICTLLLENDENLTIINPGGSPTALSHNINLLTNIEDKRINIVLTSFIPRYWSSLLEIYKRFSINMVVIPEDNIYISYKLSRYLDKISARKVIKVKN